jgi:MinD-like ATPase involved in chromosome partitioning or flagellar assembly
MINIFNTIEHLKKKLTQLLNRQILLNYHVLLGINNETFIYLLVADNQSIDDSIHSIIDNYPQLIFKIVTPDECQDDYFYKDIFKKPNGSVNIQDNRRRFIHLLDEDDTDKTLNPLGSVITFYSYKGGLGRSTSLASFAMSLANGVLKQSNKMISPQKVVIIDFDLEAPGFTNFFLEDVGIPFYHNGVVEYLIDIEHDTNIDIRDYMWKVSEPFAGKGEIFIMPAGNLNPKDTTSDFLKNNLNHYLEGLARLDISSPGYLVKQIKEKIIQKIQEIIEPDFILIDSRAGFNDIFGITALQLSDAIVGFFGSGAQTDTGLHFFLNTLLKHPKTKGFIVNAILPELGWIALFKSFQQKVEQILQAARKNGTVHSYPLFKINRNAVLEHIGMKAEDIRYLQYLILDREFKDYYQLFDKIYASSKQ